MVVTVFVRGKDGKPKKGLKKETCRLENGKAQAVSVFEFQELCPASRRARRRAPPSAGRALPDKRLLVLFFD